MGKKLPKKWACWIALACLVVPMFASYYFDDMFSSISYLFQDSGLTELRWDENDYGRYTSGYSVLCIIGGLALFGILLDKWGVRVAGTLYVGMMVAGAGIVTWALLGGQKNSAALAYAGCMVFGLGSEMAGTVVNRSIGRWFKDGGMALAMGLHLAIARLGTAFALVVSPKLVAQQADHVYSLAETARPALLGMGLMAVGLILWAAFVAMDAKRFPKQGGLENKADDFRFKDLFKVLGNKNFWLLGLLCVGSRRLDGVHAAVLHRHLRAAVRPDGGQGGQGHALDDRRFHPGAGGAPAVGLRPLRRSVLGLSVHGDAGLRLLPGPGRPVAERPEDRPGQDPGHDLRPHLLGAEPGPAGLQAAGRQHPGQRIRHARHR